MSFRFQPTKSALTTLSQAASFSRMKLILSIVAVIVSLLLPSEARGDTSDGWPRSFTSNGTTVTVYQPQVTSWAGNVLSFRAAVSVLPQGAAQSLFGTVAVSGTTDVDNDQQTVSLSNLNVARANFPSAPDQAQAYGTLVLAQADAWAHDLSLPAVKANLAVTNAEGAGAKTVPVKNAPPTIFFSESPAILILVDGAPALRPVADTTLLRAINTQSLLLMDQSSGTYFLRVNGSWAQAASVGGPWTASQNPPASLDVVLQQATKAGNVQLFDPPAGTKPSMPVIYVSTSPAELITTQGPPAFAPVAGTQLLHVTNSGSSLFMNTANQSYYVVISGRWFLAAAFQGPWQFVPANQLPPDFANIPETAPAGTVLASVAGTPQANEAAISSTIPQTATISRNATTQLSYDGTPQFEPIETTKLAYAKNTATPVIKVSSDNYYAVVNGVWFHSKSPSGPWAVADSVAPEIYSIPPSSPVYYATNVMVYGSTPDVVYTGYTPGYFGTCLAPEGVVVFGTGFAYPPYIGTNVWFGPPLTYGFGAGFACGLATGFAFGLAADHGWGCSPWWGPWHGGWGNASFNRNVTNNWNNVNVNSHNAYNRWGNNNVINNNRFNKNNLNNEHLNNEKNQFSNWKNTHPNAGQDVKNDANRQADRHPEENHPNADHAVTEHHPDANRAVADRPNPRSDTSRLGDNNVFAGRDGNAYRSKEDGSWEKHDSSGWKPADRSNLDNSTRGDLESHRASRSVGSTRSFGGGGFHGGGGFRGGGRR